MILPIKQNVSSFVKRFIYYKEGGEHIVVKVLINERY
jgi:hypothetical protein